MNSQDYLNSHALQEQNRLRRDQLLNEAEQERLVARSDARGASGQDLNLLRSVQALAAFLLNLGRH